MSKITYTAVVETGSCSPDYKRWETRTDCGHAHKTREAAEKCLAKKQTSYCNHGRVAGTPCRHCLGYAQNHSTSALWYNGNIHNQNSERA
jgi:hypothetical protein